MDTGEIVTDASLGPAPREPVDDGYYSARHVWELWAEICQREGLLLDLVLSLHESGDLLPLPAAAPARAKAGRELLSRDVMIAELASLLHKTNVEAARLFDTAMAMKRLVETHALLKEGLLDYRRVVQVAEVANPLAQHHYDQAIREGLSPAEAERRAREVAARVEALLYPKACRDNPKALSGRLIRAVIKTDPAYAEAKRKAAHRGRSLTHRTNPEDGTGDLWAHLDAATVQAIYEAVNGHARVARSQGDERTLDELRADVFAAMCLNGGGPHGSDPAGSADAGSGAPGASGGDGARGWDGEYGVIPEATNAGDVPPIPGDPFWNDDESCDGGRDGAVGGAGDDREGDDGSCGACGATGGGRRPMRPAGVQPEIRVLITMETLLQLNDDPCHLEGHGPITAAYARALAFGPNSTWRRLVTDPLSGVLLDFGRKRYRPPAPLADFVRARDQICSHAGCTRPAHASDLDHIKEFPLGPTSAGNLGPLCLRHHQLKTQGWWRHEVSSDPRLPANTVVMVSAGGRRYLTHPIALTEPRSPEPGPQGEAWEGDLPPELRAESWEPRRRDRMPAAMPDPAARPGVRVESHRAGAFPLPNDDQAKARRSRANEPIPF